MNVRTKLFLAMTALVLLVSAVYMATTQGYLGSRFKHYEEGQAARVFVNYYVHNGESWAGINRTGLMNDSTSSPDHRKIALFSPNGKVLYANGDFDPRPLLAGDKKKELMVNGRRIGTLAADHWVRQAELPIKAYVLHAMFVETFRVAALTAGAALLLGLWLTRRLTLPLKRLVPVFGKIAERNFDFQVPVTTKDEYGKITAALNDTARQLLASEQARQRLAADVAHELRTPISVMQCNLELLQESKRDISPERLLPIQDELIRLSLLVDDLHQLTLAEAGELPLAKEPVDLSMLLRKIVNNLQVEAEERRVDISIEAEPAQWVVQVDPQRITQVFFNLMINAVRYTPQDGRVTIELHEICIEHNGEPSRYAAVSISDTGVGIEPEQLPHVFDRFYRAQESRSRHSGGMGLGLAIAKEFVEAHRGFIEAKSRVGEGTTFTVCLPLP